MTFDTSQMKVAQWSVIHEVLARTWRALNGEATMPPNFPQEVVNALDDNLKIIYFDLLKLYDIINIEQGPQGPTGTLMHSITENHQIIPEMTRINDFVVNFTTNDLTFQSIPLPAGSVFKITSLEPFALMSLGNLQGPRGVGTLWFTVNADMATAPENARIDDLIINGMDKDFIVGGITLTNGDMGRITSLDPFMTVFAGNIRGDGKSLQKIENSLGFPLDGLPAEMVVLSTSALGGRVFFDLPINTENNFTQYFMLTRSNFNSISFLMTLDFNGELTPGFKKDVFIYFNFPGTGDANLQWSEIGAFINRSFAARFLERYSSTGRELIGADWQINENRALLQRMAYTVNDIPSSLTSMPNFYTWHTNINRLQRVPFMRLTIEYHSPQIKQITNTVYYNAFAFNT